MNELFSTPTNPIPSKAWVGHVLTRDGIQLRAARWAATGRKRRGTICIVQGRAQCIEFYFETITHLRRQGFHVVAFDFRGQGGSQRLLADARKCHVTDFRAYEDDVCAVFEHVVAKCPKPYGVLAHSTGAAVMLNMAHRMCHDDAGKSDFPFSRMMLITPNIAIQAIENQPWKQQVVKILAHIGMGRSYIPGGGATANFSKPFEGNDLTSNRDRYVRNGDILTQYPFLGVGDPTFAWLAASLRLAKAFEDPRFAQKIRVPTLIIAAGNDKVVSTHATERFARFLPAGHLVTLAGSEHVILSENDALREAFWRAFDVFMIGDD
jgi:lysophospholipase